MKSYYLYIIARVHESDGNIQIKKNIFIATGYWFYRFKKKILSEGGHVYLCIKIASNYCKMVDIFLYISGVFVLSRRVTYRKALIQTFKFGITSMKVIFLRNGFHRIARKNSVPSPRGSAAMFE